MALDELKRDDRVYETNGIKIIIDKKESKKIKGMKIEVLDTILGKIVLVEDLYKTKGGCH